MQNKLKLGMIVTMLLLTALLEQGCLSSAASAPLPVSLHRDSTKELMQHPQFPLAARVAPDLIKAYHHRIHELELKCANAGIQD